MVTLSQVQHQITLEEFLDIPETKPSSEYIDGKIEQKPMPQGQHSVLQDPFRNSY
jgi:Uma2 family endonuclease